MPMRFEIADDLHDVVAHNGPKQEAGQARLAQIDEVPDADLEQVGQFWFSKPLVWRWRGRCRFVHTHMDSCQPTLVADALVIFVAQRRWSVG